MVCWRSLHTETPATGTEFLERTSSYLFLNKLPAWDSSTKFFKISISISQAQHNFFNSDKIHKKSSLRHYFITLHNYYKRNFTTSKVTPYVCRFGSTVAFFCWNPTQISYIWRSVLQKTLRNEVKLDYLT